MAVFSVADTSRGGDASALSAVFGLFVRSFCGAGSDSGSAGIAGRCCKFSPRRIAESSVSSHASMHGWAIPIAIGNAGAQLARPFSKSPETFSGSPSESKTKTHPTEPGL